MLRLKLESFCKGTSERWWFGLDHSGSSGDEVDKFKICFEVIFDWPF